MNDQVTPAVEVRRRSAAPWLILALVVILAAVAVWFLTAKRIPEGDPAGFLPGDCMTASTFDFRSSPDKQAALDVIEDIFKDAGVDNMEAWLFKQMSDGIDVDVEKDVLPKLSGTGGMASLPAMVGMMQPETVIVVGAKSEADASALAKIWSDVQRKKGTNVAEAVYEGVKYYKYAEGFSTSCLGAVKSAVVYGNSESAFKKVCDTVNGRQASLAEQSTYINLRDEMKPSTIGTSYMSGPSYYKGFIEPILAMGGAQVPEDLTKALADLFNGMEAVATADANGDGMISRQKCRMPEGLVGGTDVDLDELAEIAPENAAVVFAGTGVNKSIAYIKEHVLSGKSTKPYVDQFVAGAKMGLGIDPFADGLDRITGFGMYFVPKPASKLDKMPGHFVLVLTVDKPSVIQTTLTKLKAFASMQGANMPETRISGQTVTLIDAGPSGPRMGFTLVGDKLLFAITEKDIKDAMMTAIPVAQRKKPSLASSGSYAMVRKQMPAQSSMLFYADPGAIALLAKPALDAQGKRIADAITRRIGPVGMSSESSGNEAIIHTVMPFKK